MRALPFKIPKPNQDALIYQVDLEVAFYDKLHQHEEIQVSLIVEGEGALIVGDSINYYTKNDVVVIGSNIPHLFKSDTTRSDSSKMITLFFTKSSFGKDFFELEELKKLDPFFKSAKHGFKVTSNLNPIKDCFFRLEHADKLDRFLILLEVLKLCAISTHKGLSSFISNKKYTDNEGNRMRNIFEYTINNYSKEVSLKTIAEVANMTKNAFCKYFKKRTNKTYFQFLNELRIENSCKHLLEDKDTSITEIAEKVGFNNMSNFNRQFKTIKKMSPSEFRRVKY
ncbi:AraC family transcriptional regulator [Algibacter pacificus]|uniref:AraC family transcriptional regulator n=1 Tax=Algibacter pacificus TaxID=2599389 RepID=UPI0011C8AEE5|nr:AraC family transcriptional regulator [Algibacter pacificus]